MGWQARLDAQASGGRLDAQPFADADETLIMGESGVDGHLDVGGARTDGYYQLKAAPGLWQVRPRRSGLSSYWAGMQEPCSHP